MNMNNNKKQNKQTNEFQQTCGNHMQSSHIVLWDIVIHIFAVYIQLDDFTKNLE